MIQICNLWKSFGETEILKDINLNIKEGEIFGLVGRSGAGKSTLLRCINGLENYDKGSINVDGFEIKNYTQREIREYRKNIGMIFQQFPLMSRKTVYENISIPLECWGYKRKYIDSRVKELVEIVEIEDKINDRPECLSGGEKQRVAIARALSLNPKILLCDEATSALDPKTTKSILELLKKINEQLGITIVLVTHQMSVIKDICQKVAILEGGRITSKGKVSDIFYDQPPALKNLMGEEYNIKLPKHGINIKISYKQNFTNNNILYELGDKSHIPFSLVWSKIDSYTECAICSMIINTDEQYKEQTINFLKDRKIKVEVLGSEQ